MDGSDDQVSLNGGSRDVNKLGKEQLFALISKGQGACDEIDEHAAIAQHKEGEVEHDAEIDEEFQSALSDCESVLCEIAAGRDSDAGELLFEIAEIDVEVLEEALGNGECRLEPVEVTFDIDLPALQTPVDLSALFNEEGDEEEEWDDPDKENNQESCDGRYVGAPFPQFEEALIERLEEEADDARPEDGGEKGFEEVEEVPSDKE